MDILQKLLENTLQEAFSLENIVASILNKKLKEMGIVLSDKQLAQLQEEIKDNKNLDTFSFKINEEEALQCPSHLMGKSDALISLSIDAKEDLTDAIGVRSLILTFDVEWCRRILWRDH